MKYECEVIRDLLPLYMENVCSLQSKKVIEEHLNECADCQNYLDTLKEAEVVEDHCYDREKESRKERFIKYMNRKIKLKWIITLAVTILTLLLVGSGIYHGLESSRVYINDTSRLSIENRDGDLILSTKGAISKDTYSIRFTLSDGNQQYDCIVLTQYTSKLNDLFSADNVYSEYVIAYKDKGADSLERVYYCINEDNMDINENPILDKEDIKKMGFILLYSR